MTACYHYGRGDFAKAMVIGGQYEDIELGFLMCDTGMMLDQFEATPRRMQRVLRMITRVKRVLDARRMF